MEVASCPEALISVQRSTLYRIPEDELDIFRRKNLNCRHELFSLLLKATWEQDNMQGSGM
jgi:hypothetical protein